MNTSPSYSPNLVKRIFASGVVGNMLEGYDLLLMSFMTTILSQVFFPPSINPYDNVVDFFYIFFISRLFKPIGNVIIALLADQIGRKKIIVTSLTIVGICSTLLGILPSYQDIGPWSTFIFAILRIFMYIFTGAEYVISIVYLIESSSPKNRVFFGSWVEAGMTGSYLMASVVCLIIFSLINNNIIPEWGWRFTFLLSPLAIFFGKWVRSSIPESLEFIMNNANNEKPKLLTIFKKSIRYIKKHSLECFSIGSVTLIGTFLSSIYYMYIPVNLIITRHFTQITAISINVISLLFLVLLIPIFGKISDYYNKIKLLKIACFFIAILAFPFFLATSYGTCLQITFASILIAIPTACIFAIYPSILTERFPSIIRCTISSLIHQIIFSLGLGILPLLLNYLVNITKLPYVAAYILVFSSLFAFIGVSLLQLLDIKKSKFIELNLIKI